MKPRPGNWQQIYGARRRASDRVLLAECEAVIAAIAEPAEPSLEQAAIARAFGRPGETLADRIYGVPTWRNK